MTLSIVCSSGGGNAAESHEPNIIDEGNFETDSAASEEDEGKS